MRLVFISVIIFLAMYFDMPIKPMYILPCFIFLIGLYIAVRQDVKEM